MAQPHALADAYQPNPVYIKEGQTIIWINNDNNIHTVTQKNYPGFTNSFGNILGFNSGILNRGQSFAQIFNKEGTYNYYCTIHPWMVGQVVVSKNSNSNTTNTVANTNNTINSSTTITTTTNPQFHYLIIFTNNHRCFKEETLQWVLIKIRLNIILQQRKKVAKLL